MEKNVYFWLQYRRAFCQYFWTDKRLHFHYYVCKLAQILNASGPVAQSVASLTADPGVPSSVPAQSYTFVEIDNEIISTIVLFLLLLRKYVHKVLDNRLVELANEKVWLGELTVSTLP